MSDGPGRPKELDGRTHMIRSRVRASEYALILAAADKAEISVSELVRIAALATSREIESDVAALDDVDLELPAPVESVDDAIERTRAELLRTDPSFSSVGTCETCGAQRVPLTIQRMYPAAPLLMVCENC